MSKSMHTKYTKFSTLYIQYCRKLPCRYRELWPRGLCARGLRSAIHFSAHLLRFRSASAAASRLHSRQAAATNI